MTQTRIPAHGIGVAVPRREDLRLLTGRGQYAGDHFPSGLSYAVMVRAPYAHARILAIETVEALGAPGVLAVVTGADVLAAGLRPIPHNPQWEGPPDVPLETPAGFTVFTTDHPALPYDTVRYVGEPVAMVVAETPAADAVWRRLVIVSPSS